MNLFRGANEFIVCD